MEEILNYLPTGAGFLPPTVVVNGVSHILHKWPYKKKGNWGCFTPNHRGDSVKCF